MTDREFIAGALMHSLLEIRRAAFSPKIGCRYTEAIRSEIAAECFRLEDACRAQLSKVEGAAATAPSDAEQSPSPAKGMESSSEWQHTPS